MINVLFQVLDSSVPNIWHSECHVIVVYGIETAVAYWTTDS